MSFSVRSALVIAALWAAPAWAQIRVVAYNTLDGPTPGVHDNSANMATIFSAMATQSAAGIARRPDLIILQEQTNTSAAALASLLNTTYGLTGVYVAVQPGGQPGSSDPIFIDRQAFVYNTQTLSIIGGAGTVATGEARPIIRAQFRPVGYSSNAASFYAYGAHLLSSNATARANQTAAMRANANALPAGSHAIFAGDFNMQGNGETAWQNLVTGAGDGLAVDPLNPTNAAQTWNNNASFASIHTQSTRTGGTPDLDGGATGGMDDRFDVQLSTEEFQDGEGLSFIPGTYRAFGQDGQHFNASINASPTIPLGTTVANALWDASDHLPVVVDYQLPARMNGGVSLPPKVIVSPTPIDASVQVTNIPTPGVTAGIDELDWSLNVSGAGSASVGGTVPGGGSITLAVPIRRDTPGTHVGTFAFSTTSQGGENVLGTVSSSVQAVVHARPSFDAAAETLAATVDLGVFTLGSGVQTRLFGLTNRSDPQAGFLVAGLDLDAVLQSGSTTELFTTLQPATNQGVGTTRTGVIHFEASQVGPYQTTAMLSTSDQNIPGAAAGPTLTLSMIARLALGGDADLSNTVDIDDFGILASRFNAPATGWHDGDFNRDGIVDIDDFGILASNFNTSVTPGLLQSPATVPEPAGFAGVVLTGTVLRRRRSRSD